ncbi:MAG: hypothetical protein CM15mV127_200 [Caudoviricetes sp.]|nr:MAG: hypothetical protein CM15mV127_200 [Caudoviricetes sp.]
MALMFIYLQKKSTCNINKRSITKIYCSCLGLSSKTEIYPKQTKLGKNQTEKRLVGSFINLPYFKTTERRALKPDGSHIEYKRLSEVVKVNLQTKRIIKRF